MYGCRFTFKKLAARVTRPFCYPSNSSLDALLGYKIRYVRVVYRNARGLDHKNPKEPFYEAFVETAPCGKTFRAMGMSRDTPLTPPGMSAVVKGFGCRPHD